MIVGFIVASGLFSSAVAFDPCSVFSYGDETSYCDDGHTCIKTSWKYDGESDCNDASDEGGWAAVHTKKIVADMHPTFDHLNEMSDILWYHVDDMGAIWDRIDNLKAKLDGIVTQLSG